MGHDHGHRTGHPDHDPSPSPEWADSTVPDTALSASALTRRRFLQRAGLLGAAVAAGGVGGARTAAAQPGPAEDDPRARYAYLAGDHHIHTKYSSDAIYEVAQQVAQAGEYGLDWVVITDHGGPNHQKLSIDPTGDDIEDARRQTDLLVFQGVEWNIPAGEHATVFVAPGQGDRDTLKRFEADYDGSVLAAAGTIPGAATDLPSVEQYAYRGLRFLAEQKASGGVVDALMLPNHVSRRGLDSPHELRGYRDAADGIAVGMEGAPGHQAAGIPTSQGGIGDDRGFYGNTANPDSFPGYVPESYFTFGGFDYNVTKVGGLWDSMLAEGRRWCITATSDSHFNHLETFRRGGTPEQQTSAYWNTTGQYLPPVDTGTPAPAGDFWPGYYSSTLVGAREAGYLGVIEGLRAGRTYAVHGGLVRGVDLRVDAIGGGPGIGSTVGGRARVRRGGRVAVRLVIDVADRPNFNGDRPRLAKVDLIAGPITGPVSDPDTLAAPETEVVETFEVRGGHRRRAIFRYEFRDVRRSFYIRIRGSDGNELDAAGNPTIDISGDADPWRDLWFYSSAAFVDVE